MLKKLSQFILYNNTFVFILAALVLGAGTTMAANEDIRSQVGRAVISEQTNVVSVDNTFLLEADLEGYPVSAEVISVTEDNQYYYVEYELSTIVVAEGLWQPGKTRHELQVEKQRLAGQDLGLYLAQELDELITAEKQQLSMTQTEERTIGRSQKVAVTEYSGLVGQLMNSATKVFPGYEPVIEQKQETVDPSPAKPEPVTQSNDRSQSNSDEPETLPEDSTDEPVLVDEEVTEPGPVPDSATTSATSSEKTVATSTESQQATSSQAVGTTTPEEAADVTEPELTLNGPASLTLIRGEAYMEAGVQAVDQADGDLTSEVSITGVVNTEVVGSYAITYEVSDSAGNVARIERQIIVEEAPEKTEVSEQTASST